MSTKFSPLLNLPPLPKIYINEGLSSTFNFSDLNKTEIAVYTTPALLFSKSKFVELLENQFNTRIICRYLKNPPNSIYDWHTDIFRLTAINWIVKSNPNARVWYRSNNRHRLFWDLEEVVYQDHYPTLLDSKQEHSVFNNSAEERIILSVTIFNGPSYQELLNFLSALNINQY
jgi:hypothetical protein